MKHFLIPTLAITALLTVGACKSSQNTASPSRPASATTTNSRIIDNLVGDWTIVNINGTPVSAASDGEVPYLGFSRNASDPSLLDFYAYNGCNFINGAIAIDKGAMKRVGENTSTMRMCADAPYEMAIATALETMKTFRIERVNDSSFLYIVNGAGQTVMTLRKHNLEFLDAAWRVTRLNGKEVPSKSNILFVVDLQGKTIHGNAGCNVLNGAITVDMDRENGLQFTNLATTRMSCPDMALEQEFLQALGQVRSAVSVNGGKNCRLRNADNATIIELRKMSKDELRELD